MTQIDMNKEYRTRDGRSVRIYATDGGGEFPVQGAVCRNNKWTMYSWKSNGSFFLKERESSLDLIEIIPSFYANVVKDNSGNAFVGCSTFPTESAAKAHKYSTLEYIKTIKVEL